MVHVIPDWPLFTLWKLVAMALRFFIHFLLSVYFVYGFSIDYAHQDEEDQTIKIMEDFSGYPIHETHFSNSLSSLSVDTENLQKQVFHY